MKTQANPIELDEIRKRLQKDFNEGLEKLKKECDEFLNSSADDQFVFQDLIKKILLLAWDKQIPDTFLGCYVKDKDTYNSPHVVMYHNLYDVYINLSNGEVLTYITSQSLTDYDIYTQPKDIPENESVIFLRKELIRSMFIAAFSNDPEEIKSVEDYNNLHSWMTDHIIQYAAMVIRTK